MNSANFKIVKSFTRAFLFSFFYFAQVKVHAFEVDFSRRQPSSIEKPKTVLIEAPVVSEKPAYEAAQVVPTTQTARPFDNELVSAIKKAVLPFEPEKEIIILNTEAGFVPAKISVKKGEAYRVHVVNINIKEKNVSFLMDAFTKSYNTVYGSMKTFDIEPQVEGVYSFQCPETGVEGKLIVVSDKLDKVERQPSSEKSEESHVR